MPASTALTDSALAPLPGRLHLHSRALLLLPPHGRQQRPGLVPRRGTSCSCARSRPCPLCRTTAEMALTTPRKPAPLL